ncbi:MAG: hypothetical protein ACK4ZY_12745, partial [Sphingomonas sp.]
GRGGVSRTGDQGHRQGGEQVQAHQCLPLVASRTREAARWMLVSADAAAYMTTAFSYIVR